MQRSDEAVNRMYLYSLSAVLAIAGLSLFFYKVYFLGFPVAPKTRAQVWNVEAHVSFVAQDKPVKVSMFIPAGAKRFAILDEHFISSGYGLVVSTLDGNRKAAWSIRKARGRQNVYYQAVVRSVRAKPSKAESEVPQLSIRNFEGPKQEAARSLLGIIRAKSADTPSMVAELIQRLNKEPPDDRVDLLLGRRPTTRKKAEMAVRLLEEAGVPARLVQGIHLQEERQEFFKRSELLCWFEYYDRKQWQSCDAVNGRSPVPNNWIGWWRGPGELVEVTGGDKLKVTVSVSPKVEEGVTSAILRGEISKPLLLKFSLFSLPVNTQAVYRVTLLVPVGALVLVLLRNIVGIKTFGTFMPVLIALAFRETGLLWGIFLFCVLVTLGLTIRFYLERLKLLVVPRLAAVLIVVVGLMAMLSILSHNLGIHRGLSVALFPMVILTMTIERMSILWEERGSTEALVSGLGSLLTAALAFMVMNVKYIEHLFFVFPELLLVLLAITLLVGRYSGYRLMDLFRFKALAGGGE